MLSSRLSELVDSSFWNDLQSRYSKPPNPTELVDTAVSYDVNFRAPQVDTEVDFWFSIMNQMNREEGRTQHQASSTLINRKSKLVVPARAQIKIQTLGTIESLASVS